jgi:hypothetical protein
VETEDAGTEAGADEEGKNPFVVLLDLCKIALLHSNSSFLFFARHHSCSTFPGSLRGKKETPLRRCQGNTFRFPAYTEFLLIRLTFSGFLLSGTR